MDRNELAHAVGSSYREILRWETTTQEPRAVKLKQIADALNINIEYFLQDTPFSAEAENAIIYYVPKEEFYSLTGFSEIFDQYKTSCKLYLNRISKKEGLSIALRIMTGFVGASDLPVVYIIVLQDILGKAVDNTDETKTPDNIRQELKQCVDSVDDPDVLRVIGKILVTYTRTQDVKEELALLTQLAAK